MSAEFKHHVLGNFVVEVGQINPRGDFFTDLEKTEPTTIEGLGLSFPEFTMFLKNESTPKESDIQELVNLIEYPPSRKGELEALFFEKYRDDIYPHYRQFYADPEFDFEPEQIERMLPSIDSPSDTWSLVLSERHIAGIGPWEGMQVLTFTCLYDDEHDLHFGFKGDSFVEVWNE